MNQYKEYDEEFIKNIEKQITKKNSYNQIDLDKYKIEALVQTFFGKFADPTPGSRKYSKSYDWFYNSLADSNKTFSLRLFLDLIKEGIKRTFENNNEYYPNPILHPFFYNHKVPRKLCVKNYFQDLANEEGNEDFKHVIEFIRDSLRFPEYLRYRRLHRRNYEKFLDYFINNDNINLSCSTRLDLEEILIVNGAIKIYYEGHNEKACEFAYLYKYYLNLR
jgi:hypothetical protein